MSTPYGLPSTCSSIHLSSISSCSGENASAPSTPKPPARLTAATTSRQWLNAKIGNSIPKVSQRRVCMSDLLRRLKRRREMFHRHREERAARQADRAQLVRDRVRAEGERRA